jgi:pimeloyl-ACP methyl ester carboxylesterase
LEIYVQRLLTLTASAFIAIAVATIWPGQNALADPQQLRWSPCPKLKDAQCTIIQVPVDPSRPGGQKFTLRIGRIRSSDSAHKRGVLVFLPGGPGAGIDATIGANREAQHIDDLRRYYDIVTFDPRGIGLSSPIRCAPGPVPKPGTPSNKPLTRAQFDALASRNGAFFRNCMAVTGPLMSHLSALDTAADVERIRQALTPNVGLIAYGGSYGSQYGQAYLERYGSNVKVLVLDAVTDHSIDLPTFSTRNVLSTDDAFARFSSWCSRTASCSLHGRNVAAVFDADVAKAPATQMIVPQLLAAGNDPTVGWPVIAKMLAEVSGGDMKTLKELTNTAALGSTSEDPNVRAGKNGLFPGVLCADYGPQRNYDAILGASSTVSQHAPRFAWKYWDASPLAHGTAGVGDCVGWPLAAVNPPHALHVGWHGNVLVESPTHDPATPLMNAVSVWMQIPGAKLLIADTDGHQALILSKCALQAMIKFYNDPKSVDSSTMCPN